MLLKGHRHVLALDVWDLHQGHAIGDMVDGQRFNYGAWPGAPIPRLLPVPFAPFENRPHACQLLGSSQTGLLSKAEARSLLGISPDDKIVLTVTADWQLPNQQRSATARQLAHSVPQQLDRVIHQLGHRVHLCHIGPQPFPVEKLGHRYHHVPKLPPREFASVLQQADVLLSANASATTITAAYQRGIPVVVLRQTQGEPKARFHMWPLGMFEQLDGMLKDNPYCEGFMSQELNDEDGLKSSLAGLLDDNRTRVRLIDAQQGYLKTIEGLPTGADLVEKILSEAPASL